MFPLLTSTEQQDIASAASDRLSRDDFLSDLKQKLANRHSPEIQAFSLQLLPADQTAIRCYQYRGDDLEEGTKDFFRWQGKLNADFAPQSVDGIKEALAKTVSTALINQDDETIQHVTNLVVPRHGRAVTEREVFEPVRSKSAAIVISGESG